jgi:FkbM family methyltransferase
MSAAWSNSVLGRLQKWASHRPLLVRASAKLRNQLNVVFASHLNGVSRFGHTGEYVVLDRTANRVQRFVDVGANVGAWSRSLVRLAPEASGLLVEPSRPCQAALRAWLPNYPLLKLVPAALSDTSGEAMFFEESGATETSSFDAANARPGATARRITTTTLDAELARVGWPSVDWLKIDAEGYDLSVLRGAHETLRAHRIRFLQFEYNTSWARAGHTLGAALHLLESSGYQCRLVRADGLYRIDYARWGEFFGFAIIFASLPAEEATLAPLLRDRSLL